MKVPTKQITARDLTHKDKIAVMVPNKKGKLRAKLFQVARIETIHDTENLRVHVIGSTPVFINVEQQIQVKA